MMKPPTYSWSSKLLREPGNQAVALECNILPQLFHYHCLNAKGQLSYLPGACGSGGGVEVKECGGKQREVKLAESKRNSHSDLTLEKYLDHKLWCAQGQLHDGYWGEKKRGNSKRTVTLWQLQALSINLNKRLHQQQQQWLVEIMRDVVEYVTGTAKGITEKMNKFKDKFQETSEKLAQTSQDLTDKTQEAIMQDHTTCNG
jgi:hypothetical protein